MWDVPAKVLRALLPEYIADLILQRSLTIGRFWKSPGSLKEHLFFGHRVAVRCEADLTGRGQFRSLENHGFVPFERRLHRR